MSEAETQHSQNIADWLGYFIGPLMKANPRAGATELARLFRVQYEKGYAEVVRVHFKGKNPHDEVRKTIERYLKKRDSPTPTFNVRLVDSVSGLLNSHTGSDTDCTISKVSTINNVNRSDIGGKAYQYDETSGSLSLAAEVKWIKRRRKGAIVCGTLKSDWEEDEKGVLYFPQL